MVVLLKSYAWLLADVALVIFCVVELVSLRTKKPKDKNRDGKK